MRWLINPAAVTTTLVGKASSQAAPEARGMARACGATLATARTLIFGIMFGATVANMIPDMPRKISDLVADAGDDMRPRAPKIRYAKRLTRTIDIKGRDIG